MNCKIKGRRVADIMFPKTGMDGETRATIIVNMQRGFQLEDITVKDDLICVTISREEDPFDPSPLKLNGEFSSEFNKFKERTMTT